MEDKFLRMNLQFFADGDGADGAGNPEPKPNDNTPEINFDSLSEKQVASLKEKFGFKTDDEVNQLINSKFAKWQEQTEKERAEAEKLAKMNATEKTEHEKKKLEEKIAEFERKETLREMSKEASKMISEADLPHDEALIDLVTHEDAEATKKAVEVVLAYVSKIKKETARQATPSEGGSFATDKKLDLSKSEMAQKNRIIK